MATSPMSVLIQQLRTALGRDGPEMTDGELLALFLNSRDDAALAILVRRHAPMVWGVCRRLLEHSQDAEDAFQATFLVSARKAQTIRKPASVSCWLYGVASRVATKLRRKTRRQRSHEKTLL